MTVRLGETVSVEYRAGFYRVCDPFPPNKWADFSVTEDCARRMIHKGLARVIRFPAKFAAFCGWDTSL